jgi:Cu/Ag efflux protein CusF
MGRKILIFAFSVYSLTVFGCQKTVLETKPQNVKAVPTAVSPMPTPSIPKDGNYAGKGTVTKINNETGSVELNHEDIKDLMPAMQMEFYVKDKTLLKGLNVGDKVDFVVEYKHPTEIIAAIKKAQ